MTDPPAAEAPGPPDDPGPGDLPLLLTACDAHFGQQILDRCRARTGRTLRHTDGYVFQHLVVGRPTVTELAERLGVTQQAASKQVADLERRGLVERIPDPADGRSRRVALSEGGVAAVEAAREARVEIGAEAEAILGAEGAARLARDLATLARATGAEARLWQRRLRPEPER